MATKPAVNKVYELAATFLDEHDGAWDHEAWESLVSEVASLGLEPNDELRRNLGNILEASKYFLTQMPAKAPKTKTKPRAKAKPKVKGAAKPRAKAKPKSKT